MKTAMEKKETGLMRQIGYLSFVVVLLYVLSVYHFHILWKRYTDFL